MAASCMEKIIVIEEDDPKRLEETTIQIKKDTRDKIFRLGKKGESYDDIINRVMFGGTGKKKQDSKEVHA